MKCLRLGQCGRVKKNIPLCSLMKDESKQIYPGVNTGDVLLLLGPWRCFVVWVWLNKRLQRRRTKMCPIWADWELNERKSLPVAPPVMRTFCLRPPAWFEGLPVPERDEPRSFLFPPRLEPPGRFGAAVVVCMRTAEGGQMVETHYNS